MSTSSPIPGVGRALVALAIGVPLLLAFAVASPAQARRPPTLPKPSSPKYEGCGVLTVAAAPWQNFIDGARREQGDHWIISQRRTGASCSAARSFARALIDDDKFFSKRADTTFARFRGNFCLWSFGSGHETIAPFRHIVCELAVRVGRRRVMSDMGADVDPDPRFITPGPAR
jgi:hypothetical protein